MRSALLVGVLLVTGCPGAPSKTSKTSAAKTSTKAPTAKTPAAKTTRSAKTTTGDGGGTATPRPTGEATPEPGMSPTPTPTTTPSPTPSATAALPPGSVQVRPGTLLRPQPKLAVGLVEVRRRPELVAWLAVGIGEMAFRVHLVKGDRLIADATVFRVAALSVKGGVHLAPVKRASTEARIATAPKGTRLKLPTMGLYQLADGRVIGVGNARAPRSIGGKAGAPRVPITVYPAGYAKNPVLEYDLHEAVRPKQRVRGKVAKFVVARVSPDKGEVRGEVWLRLVQ